MNKMPSLRVASVSLCSHTHTRAIGMNGMKAVRLLGKHELDELCVVNLAITINVGLPNHFIAFVVGELLPQIAHDVAKLSCRNVAVAVLVKHLESL